MAKMFKKPPAVLPQEGMHPARVYNVIHLGTQKITYMGETQLKNQIRVDFEIPTETHVFNPEKGEQPLSVKKTYNISENGNMSTQSNLFKDMKNAKVFTEEARFDFDAEKDLLGQEFMINVTYSKCGNYANISSVNPMPKGQTCLPAVNPQKYFFMGFENKKEDFDEEAFANLTEYQQKQIKETMQYKMTHGEQSLAEETFKPEQGEDGEQFEEKKSLK